jgi:hypothetical protein
MAARSAACVLVAALALASGCKDPVAPAQSVYLMLETVPSPFGGGAPAPPPRAVNFRFVGRQSGFAPSLPGSTIFTSAGSADTVTVMVIAPMGQVLNGALVRVSVPDAGLATSDDAVRLLQAAASDYSLVSTLSYAMKIQALLTQ